MPQMVLNLCDVCHDQSGTQEPGETIIVSINGRKPLMVLLCESHREALVVPLQETLKAYGSTENGSRPKRTDDHDCPDCNYVGPTRGALGSHLRAQHGKTLGSAGLATPRKTVVHLGALPCPECGREFDRAASLGAHRQRVHGASGKSPAATQSKAKRAS